MATTKKPKPKRKKPVQAFIPGTEPPSIPELDEAAEAYVELRDGRMELGRQEADAALQLLALLREHKLGTYETRDGKIVSVSDIRKVKVKRKTEDTDA